jgi:hypothetical protein
MTTKKLIVPAVHLNGTGKNDLLDALEKAYRACNDAYDALRQTAPNGRDYYVYGPDAYSRARDEHLQRMRAIDTVVKELEGLAIGIQDGDREVEIDA